MSRPLNPYTLKTDNSSIMADLDATAQKLLNRDPSNPNSPKKAEPAARSGLGLSKSTMTSSKPSLRETMMAQKKATLGTKGLAPRPGSAMAHLSPVRTVSNSSNHSNATTKATAATRTRAEPARPAGGMSVAPMRPTRRRPELAARPATAGPYSRREQPEVDSPESFKSKTFTPKAKDTPPKRIPATRPRPGHAPHASEPNISSPPAMRNATKPTPRTSPPKLRQAHTTTAAVSPYRARGDAASAGPAKVATPESAPPSQTAQPHEEEAPAPAPGPEHVPSPSPAVSSPPTQVPEIALESQPLPASPRPLEVFEDPFTDAQPAPKSSFVGAVLEDKHVNEDAANLQRSNGDIPGDIADSPEKTRQDSRLLDSGIAKIQAKSLEVHGFRKLQSLLRDSKMSFPDDRKFESLLLGLFDFLEDSLSSTPPAKALDVKAQILATVKLLLRKERSRFQPHVSRGLEALLQSRSAYDSRAHIVSGLEILANELVSLGDGAEVVVVLTTSLQDCSDATTEGCRSLTMGLHVLGQMLDRRGDYVPSAGETGRLAALSVRCIESADSGVRMAAVQLCVALHARVGEEAFWATLEGVRDESKSLITYYIVKRQREQGLSAGS